MAARSDKAGQPGSENCVDPGLFSGNGNGSAAALSRSSRSGRRLKDPDRDRERESLIRAVCRMGYPEDFAAAIAENLRTEKMMHRMTRYLALAHPRSAEEIADEMLAIMEDRDRWVKKKTAEFYNEKYNRFLDEWEPEE